MNFLNHPNASNVELMQSVFNLIDTDGSGVVSVKEFGRAIHEVFSQE
jgi:Ca2+-binding EF-hand superfamily protein